jgi:serine/threonine protein kinase
VGVHRRFGGYELGEVLGEGALGVVYRARSADGGVVALKILRSALADDDVYRRRFAREVRVARSVRNRHLVAIVDAGEAQGRPYVAAQYVAGGSLAERLVRDGPLPPETLVRVVVHVAAGLDALHRAGLVHRDVKPENVMLEPTGDAALTDFGLAKGPAYTVLTRPGEIPGTLDYLAPEVIRGAEADAASDVYALGCLAYACATGAPPFAGLDPFDVGAAHIGHTPEPPPLPRDLAWALLQALSKDPAARPPTAAVYGHLLRTALG